MVGSGGVDCGSKPTEASYFLGMVFGHPMFLNVSSLGVFSSCSKGFWLATICLFASFFASSSLYISHGVVNSFRFRTKWKDFDILTPLLKQNHLLPPDTQRYQILEAYKLDPRSTEADEMGRQGKRNPSPKQRRCFRIKMNPSNLFKQKKTKQ